MTETYLVVWHGGYELASYSAHAGSGWVGELLARSENKKDRKPDISASGWLLALAEASPIFGGVAASDVVRMATRRRYAHFFAFPGERGELNVGANVAF